MLGSTYLNATTRHIYAVVRVDSSANSSVSVLGWISGVAVEYDSVTDANYLSYSGGHRTITLLIPPGQQYGVSCIGGACTIGQWLEI